MTARETRSRIVNLAASVRDLAEDELMTNTLSIVAKSSHSSATVLLAQANESSQDAQMQNFFFFRELIFEDEKREYHRLKKVEEKAVRAQKMQRLKERERQSGISSMILSIKNADASSMSNSVDADLNKQLRAKKYFDIIKLFTYMKKFILELKDFIRTCHNVFSIKFVIYKKHQSKINFAVPLLSSHVSGSKWTGFKYRLSLNVAAKSINTGTKFCQFLKEHVSSIKLRIVNVGAKLHAVKQRFNQTIFQLMIYFKALKSQGTILLSDSMRANYLIQALHKYIRKELCRRDVDMTSRKVVKKAALSIKNIEKKPAHLRRSRGKESKSNDSNKRKREKLSLEEDHVNAITDAGFKPLKKKRGRNQKGKRDLSGITCYNCQKKGHYKNACLKLKKKKKS